MNPTDVPVVPKIHSSTHKYLFYLLAILGTTVFMLIAIVVLSVQKTKTNISSRASVVPTIVPQNMQISSQPYDNPFDSPTPTIYENPFDQTATSTATDTTPYQNPFEGAQ